MTLTDKDKRRFWAKVQKSDSCWLWTAYRTSFGYGQFGLGKRLVYAHRISWVLKHGDLDRGKCVLHHCDNASCVNPSHLFLGTLFDNNRDMRIKGRIGTPN